VLVVSKLNGAPQLMLKVIFYLVFYQLMLFLLFQWLLDLLQWGLVTGLNLIIDLINLAIVFFAGVLGSMLSILPSPSFNHPCPSALVELSNNISWFFPLGTVFDCVGLFSVAVGGYFAIRPVLKFFQLT